MDSLPINIGAQPQLFVDNHLIEMVNFVTRHHASAAQARCQSGPEEG